MPAKTQRRSRAELKEMMLEAASEVLLGLKPDLGFGDLTYSSVFEHLLETQGQKVTIGSVHERIWDSQREFQLEVLANLIKDLPRDHFAIANAEITAVAENADLSTLEGRRYTLQTAVRLAQNAAWKPASAFTPTEVIALSLRLRLWALDPADPEAAEFFELTRRNRLATMQYYNDMMRHWMKLVNVRGRSDTGDVETLLQTLAASGTALSTGFLVDVLDLPSQVVHLPTGPNGEPEEWYPLAISLWAMVRGMFEFADEGLTAGERRL